MPFMKALGASSSLSSLKLRPCDPLTKPQLEDLLNMLREPLNVERLVSAPWI